ncbi:MAG: AAA family ATPase [Gaiellaceae bacterium]
MASLRTVVVSGAPGTGKTTVATAVAGRLRLPLLSLDTVKEALADVLGTGDGAWSDALGDAAAEVLFRLAAEFPAVVVEGWWRRERRERAQREFAGCLELFCRCSPPLAEQRMRERHDAGRHPIHRDVIDPTVLLEAEALAGSVEPLGVGAYLVEVDTSGAVDWDALAEEVRAALS